MFRIILFSFKSLFTSIGSHRFPPWYVLRLLATMRVSPDLTHGAQRVFYRYPTVKIVVFGHTHKPAYVPMKGGKSYYNTGTWDELTGMAPGIMGTRQRYTYLLISHTKEGPKPELMRWRGTQKVTEEFFSSGAI